ncbi:iron-containing alcohol dehydrogenase, partial [Cutibacterium acnes]|uniref:iron-containing alcohol dehydrogenase n=1 Tax=Cutibacterium acnes TaxID=1747 RepID=UPI00254AB2D7
VPIAVGSGTINDLTKLAAKDVGRRYAVVGTAASMDGYTGAGAPSRPEDIGLTAADVRATFPKAMYYRSRYTVLDLAREAGWYEELVEEVFAPDGLWT